MCIYESYNKVLQSDNPKLINKFMDKYCRVDNENHCAKICGGCDYLGMLDDKLVELEGE